MDENETPMEREPEDRALKGRKPRRWPRRLGILLLLLVVAAAGFVGGQLYSMSGSSSGTGVRNGRVMQKLRAMESYVDRYFFNDTDGKELEDGIYRGFMDSLDDDYAIYYTKEEYAELLEEDSGQYVGIGVTVREDTDTGYAVIDAVNKDGPAYEAGIKVGDMILAVDEKETAEMTLNETVAAIRDQEGEVTLTIWRDAKTMEFTVETTDIQVESVTWEMRKEDIGYIAVSQFIENTAEQFDEALSSLEEEGMTGLILDLRDNGGGLLTTCLTMVSRMIPDGQLIVYTEDKNGNRTEYNSDSDDEINVPIVILVNENTASASEILTGCLKDYDLAQVVGETTYGKGIVQNIISLGDGTAIKMTVSQYFTPLGNNIHKVGVEPDAAVNVDDEQWARILSGEEDDVQYEKAVEILCGD